MIFSWRIWLILLIWYFFYETTYVKKLEYIYFLQPLNNSFAYFLDKNWQLKKLIYAYSDDETQLITKKKNVPSTRRHQPNHTTLEKKIIHISHSLFYDARRAGVSENDSKKIYQIFLNRIDFKKDLRKGDYFIIIYDKVADNAVGKKILAVYYFGKKKQVQAFLYQNQVGEENYYDENGYDMNVLFLAPVVGHVVSSGFQKRRFHPILKVYRAHKGIDYKAKNGTPVRASADGFVSRMEFAGNYGNVIFLKHNQKYTTVYAHLSKFSPQLSPKNPVKRGEIIGYVGKTGLATAAHLHFEIRVYNTPRDPLPFLALHDRLSRKSELKDFQKKIAPFNLFAY